MNPTKYFKIFLITNAIVLILSCVVLIFSNYLSYKEMLQHELTILVKSHRESILKENFRDIVSSLDINDEKYFLEISKNQKKGFQNGNPQLNLNGQCEVQNLFQFNILYCKESASLSPSVMIFIFAAIVILMLGSFIFFRLNGSLKKSFQDFFDVIKIKHESCNSLADYWNSILLLGEEFSENQKKLVSFERQKAFSELTTKVAHDIRSPLLALNLIKNKIDKNSDVHQILDMTISRIQSIANDILSKRKEATSSDLVFCMTSSLDVVLDDIFKEKKVIYPGINFFKIKNESSEKTFFSQSKVISKAEEIGRIFSNLIDNSVQALDSCDQSEKNISYEMSCDEKFFKISVKDNGPGIDPDLLKKLGEEELTTKAQGNGIALLYAKKLLKSWQGDLIISSEKDRYTEISIQIARKT